MIWRPPSSTRTVTLFPSPTLFRSAVRWLMVLMAVTWDVMGGQTGYNSLGNIAFFGVGMYVSAVVQIAVVYDVAEYTAAFGAIRVDFTASQYFGGLALGLAVAGDRKSTRLNSSH